MRMGIVVLAALAGCSDPAETVARNGAVASPEAKASPTAVAQRYLPEYHAKAWIGHWTGVEGMVLDIVPAGPAGPYRLTMQWDLDHKGTFEGDSVHGTMAPALFFTRDGQNYLLRPTDGKATGLKYLTGKKDCLTVKPGEGYCRD